MTRALPDEHVPDALDEHQRRRLQRAIRTARDLLGDASDEPPSQAHLRPAIAALVAALDARAPGSDEAGAQAEHEAELRRLRQRVADRADALDRLQAAIARLREITSPATMLQRAAAELSASSPLDRVVVSAVRGATMLAEAVHFRDDEDGARTALDALRAHPIRLEHPLVEAEVLRRRRATVVTQARVHPRVDERMAEIMGWESYLVAPVTVGSSAVALIHADRGPRQPLHPLERDVLWAFATGLAQAYDSARLRRTLRHEREQLRQFLGWLDARSGELSDAAIELVVPERPASALLPDARERGPLARGEAAALEGLLTRRELEVMRLLALGRTNRAIADELVISGGTVKFHVNSILRKLRAANRVEAVARYHALRGMSRRDEREDD